MNQSVTNRAAALIPRGVADYFWTEAHQRRALETLLLETFRTWGYEDVLPPMFEYADTLTRHANAALQAELIRLQDHDGSSLALRPDMTIAVARLVGARLHDWPMPQRFCYAGSVFRNTASQAGRQREFLQAGIELLGAPSAAADAEILALTAKALQAAALPDFRLVIGQMGYFYGLLEALALAPVQQHALQTAIDRNSEPDLADFLRATALPASQRRTVEALPRLSGQSLEAILSQADTLCLNETMHKAVENLRAICAALDSYKLLPLVYLDLTEIHNLGYYTGLTFEALTPQLGFPVATGGRYDQMLGAFGKAQPAVGAAFTLDHILLAQRTHNGRYHPPRPMAPELLVAANQSAACLALVEQWRAHGIRVAVEVDGRTGEALWQWARQIGVRYALTWIGTDFELYEQTKAAQPTVRRVAADAVLPLLRQEGQA